MLDRVNVVLALGLGLWSGYSATQTIAYIAVYSFVTAWFVAAFLVIVGLVGLVFGATRRGAVVLTMAGGGHLLAFYFAVWLVTWTGGDPWKAQAERNRQTWGTRRTEQGDPPRVPR